MDNLEQKLLAEAKAIAVVGLSPDEDKPSYVVGKYLLKQGYQVYPVNPKYTSILGVRSYPSLRHIPDDVQIDIVNIFRHPADVYPIVVEATEIGASTIWMQEGISHEESKKFAEEKDMNVVMDQCIMKSHKKYLANT